MGLARNKLRAIAEKAAKHDPAKARRIQRCNLGDMKWDRREGKSRATINMIVNTALNEVAAVQPGATVITDYLRHAFTFDKPKKWNRRFSAWVRGTLQDRTQFKSLAKGFRHEQVNAAFSSQGCPKCDFVDRGNRMGDHFVCQHCGFEAQSDRVGALNHKRRRDDPEITRFTPYREVKAILLSRFHRRLEAKGVSGSPHGGTLVPRATVPGRTPDTAPSARPRPGSVKGRKGEASPPPSTLGSLGEHNT